MELRYELKDKLGRIGAIRQKIASFIECHIIDFEKGNSAVLK
jgi:hypothetical protein